MKMSGPSIQDPVMRDLVARAWQADRDMGGWDDFTSFLGSSVKDIAGGAVRGLTSGVQGAISSGVGGGSAGQTGVQMGPGGVNLPPIVIQTKETPWVKYAMIGGGVLAAILVIKMVMARRGK